MNLDTLDDSKIRSAFKPIPGAINATIGQPDFYVPDDVKTRLQDAITSNKTSYTPSTGLEELRHKIISQYDKCDDCIITSGASAALFLAFNVLQDEVIIIEPYFVSYLQILKYLGLRVIYVTSIDEIESKITSKTSGIIINSPNNPSGEIYSKKQLQNIISIAQKHDLYLISDEVYSDFDYDSLFESVGNIYKKSLVINGWSKKFALTGLRIGYVAGRTEDITRLRALQQYTFVCAPSIVQHAVNECFESKIDISELHKKRDYLVQNLKPFYEFTHPSGSFYMFLKVENEQKWYDLCLSKNLLVVPGSAFTRDSEHIRISYAMSWENIKKMTGILVDIKKNEIKN